MSKLKNKVEMACEKDPGIITTRAEILNHPGRTEDEMEALGLFRSDLKRLERSGLALRGYQLTGRGQEIRWILLVDELAPPTPRQYIKDKKGNSVLPDLVEQPEKNERAVYAEAMVAKALARRGVSNGPTK
jgi:hypothetical protein